MDQLSFFAQWVIKKRKVEYRVNVKKTVLLTTLSTNKRAKSCKKKQNLICNFVRIYRNFLVYEFDFEE